MRLGDIEWIRAKALKDLLTRNLGLRAIALFLAIGLWVFVNAGQHEAQISLQVPINYRGLPASMMIVNQRPDFVDVQISGPRTLLSLLDPSRLGLNLDLTGVAPGQASFKINPEMFNVPRQTSVTRVSPSQVVLDIDAIAHKELPVRVDIAGPVESGYAVGAIEIKPSTVTITGPSHQVSGISQIQTEPFDIKGVTSQVERVVPLVMPPRLIKVSVKEVDARVNIDEVMGNRRFGAVEVEVRDPDYKYRLYTRHVNLVIHGPVRKLSNLKLDGLVYVSAKGTPPGVHDLPVQVDLPDGLEVVKAEPDKIRLRILEAKVAGAPS
jgi:YbbR domain-containing protein